MNQFRELLLGILAALMSIIILGGSIILAVTEDSASVAQAISITPSPTQSPTPLATTLPGEPTYTPSPTPLPTSTPTQTSPPPSTSCPPPSGWVSITINPGDTLESLADTYDTSPDELAQANCLLTESLPAGATIYVPEVTPTRTSTLAPPPTSVQCGHPAGWILYTVQPGDNLYRIGLAYGVTIRQLQQANCMGYSTSIRVGDRLYVPNVPTITFTASSTPTPTKTATSTPIPPTATATQTMTPVPNTATPTFTPTESPTAAPTNTPTDTATSTMTPEATATPLTPTSG